MKHFLPVLLFLVCLSPNLNGQDTFTGCPGYFAVLNPETGGASDLSNVNIADVSLSLIGNTGGELNALAFNPVDNYLYAMSDPSFTGSPSLYRINSSGVPTLLTIVNPPTGIARAVVSFVGDVSQTGTYYFPALSVTSLIPLSYTLYLGTLDLTQPLAGMPSVTPAYIPVILDAQCQVILDTYISAFLTSILTGGPQPSGGIQDWAFNPNDGELWSYLGVESSVFKLNPLTGTAVCYPTTNPALTEFGGIFFDQTGLMYGFEVDAGNTYKIDITGCPGPLCASLTPGLGFAANSRGDAASCAWATIPLSVELTAFEAYKKGSAVLLNWTTASETNNRHFVIEKSADGETFEETGTVQGAGESQDITHYSYEDDQPFSGLNYFRLRQVDFDGRFAYSPVRVVNFSENGSIQIDIYPNPASDRLTISLSEVFDSEVKVEVFNMTGQLQLIHRAGPNQANLILEVGHLPQGKYMLKMSNGEFVATRSLVIAN